MDCNVPEKAQNQTSELYHRDSASAISECRNLWLFSEIAPRGADAVKQGKWFISHEERL